MHGSHAYVKLHAYGEWKGKIMKMGWMDGSSGKRSNMSGDSELEFDINEREIPVNISGHPK